MRIDGTAYRTIWPDGDGVVAIIDQTRLPHDFAVVRLRNGRAHLRNGQWR